MNTKKKVFIVGPDWCDITHFVLFDFEIVQEISQADIIMFTGGEDISPSLYNDTIHPTTHFTPRRDEMEVAAFKAAPKRALLIGGCRGAQLLTALSGGRLIQHCINHSGRGGHNITTTEGDRFEITSCHHQMMYPYEMPSEDYELVAYSSENLSPYYYTGAGLLAVPETFKEPEIIYYPKTRSLCIQGHPERMPIDKPVIPYINDLIKKYLYEN